MHRQTRDLCSRFPVPGSRYAQQARQRNQPLPHPARRQSGGLVSVGKRSPRASTARGQAYSPEHRVRGVSLVPRHGARVVRGRRDRAPHERAVREHQGRPRGAAGPRQHLHAGHPGHDRPRRLANDSVPHARHGAVLYRHLLPAGRSARHAIVPPRAPCRGGRLSTRAGAGWKRPRRRCASSTRTPQLRRRPPAR